MIKHSGAKYTYLIIVILTTIISITGATFAYWTARTESTSNAVKTHSTIYSISMEITPLYHGFSLIPMNDEYALKGLKNRCKDKYDRGACLAYKIRVYDYNEDLNYVSGLMDINTVGMENISYMMYRISDEFKEDSCVTIDNKHYCIAREPEHMKEGVGLSLGDEYDVSGTVETEFILLIWLTNLANNQNDTETEFILLVWLSNLKVSQNDTDIGDFNAIITMQAGNGGQIKGSISSVIDKDETSKEDDTNKDDITNEETPTTPNDNPETPEGTETIE